MVVVESIGKKEKDYLFTIGVGIVSGLGFCWLAGEVSGREIWRRSIKMPMPIRRMAAVR